MIKIIIIIIYIYIYIYIKHHFIFLKSNFITDSLRTPLTGIRHGVQDAQSDKWDVTRKEEKADSMPYFSYKIHSTFLLYSST